MDNAHGHRIAGVTTQSVAVLNDATTLIVANRTLEPSHLLRVLARGVKEEARGDGLADARVVAAG